MSSWRPGFNKGGARLQSGIQTEFKNPYPTEPNGLMVQGVVVATYVVDDPQHPRVAREGETGRFPPNSVYCDVLVYTPLQGFQKQMLRQVRVLQPRAGLHSGEVWKPKAATVNITEEDFGSLDKAHNPADMDGDHVLVGFVGNSITNPIIMGFVEHPNADVGGEGKVKGHQLKLKQTDGDPWFSKHHGTFYGIDDNGDFIVDTTHANDGSIDSKGGEPLPPTLTAPTTAYGAHRINLPLDAEEFEVIFNEIAEADGVFTNTPKVFMKFNKGRLIVNWIDTDTTVTMDETKFEVRLDGGETLISTLKDASGNLKVGDGAVHGVIWENIKAFINSFITTEYRVHKHPTGMGPSGVPDVPGTAAVDSDGRAGKFTLPDGDTP